jgi:uncharacterized membrane protein required for colicin V production
MTIWLLAIILLLSAAGVGFRQGAIRVAFSLVGIIISALLAVPLGKLVTPAIKALGASNPILLWAISPLVVFIILLSIFKVGALALHKKVDVYYRYHAGDLRLALFERINARLGLCLGFVNGLVYLILVCAIVHVFSYWTVQLSSTTGDSAIMRLVSTMGRDLQKTGMDKVAGAVTKLRESYYDSADVAGLLFRNPLLEARLSRYPGFISLGLRQEFKQLGEDQSFSSLRAQQRPIREVLGNPNASGIYNNPDMLREIWKTAQPDLKDLSNYLTTAKSEKYDSEPLLGKWLFDTGGAFLALRRDKPKLPATELTRFKRFFVERFSKTTFIAAPDHQAVIRNLPTMKFQPVQPGQQPPNIEMRNLDGKWSKSGSDYDLAIAGAEGKPARIEGSRLSMTMDGFTLVFERED